MILAIYLNIGWALATYLPNHAGKNEATTIGQAFWQGPGKTFAPGNVDLAQSQGMKLLVMAAWPLLLLMVTAAWLWSVLLYILWLIFAGGIAKLLGLV